jgi:plasmid maintenance system killer protein
VSWADRKLAKECASDRAGARRFGAEQWAVVRRRLAVLRAAPTLAAVRRTPGRLHQLTGNRRVQYALDLRGPTRLVFEPGDEPLPELPAGGIDETKVTAVRIIEVVDYHD